MQKNDNVYKRVKNSLNYNHKEQIGEINLFPSLTIPDQALSLNEIIRRFASGIPMDIGKIPVFDEDNDLPDFRKLDLAEREEYKLRFQEELDEFRRAQAAQRAAAAKAPIVTPGTAQGGASSPV